MAKATRMANFPAGENKVAWSTAAIQSAAEIATQYGVSVKLEVDGSISISPADEGIKIAEGWTLRQQDPEPL